MKQTGHLQKTLPNSQEKNQLSIFSNIIKFKGLPFLWDQTAVPLPLSPAWKRWHHFLINKLSQVHWCSLSIFLERLVQALPIQDKSTAFCPIRTGKLLPLPCCRPAVMSTRWLRFVNLAGRDTYPKNNESIKGRSLNKLLFSPVHKAGQISWSGERKCVPTQCNAHMWVPGI